MKYQSELFELADKKAVTAKLKEIFDKTDDDVKKWLDEFLQIKFLEKIGVAENQFISFLNGLTVSFEFTSKTGGYVSGFLTKHSNEIKSYIFYINDKSGNALKSFLEFREKSLNITKSIQLNTVELGGCAIINPDVLKMVERNGFEKKIIDVPESLGGKNGEKMEIFVKKFKIK